MKFPAGTLVIGREEKYSAMPREEIERRILNDKDLIDSIREYETLMIINDAHRATPSHIATEVLLSVDGHQITTIAIATGTHKPPTEQELDNLIQGRARGLQLHVHDAHRDETEYIRCGVTSRVTEVLVDPIVKKFENIVCINSVEPHYFAGFTGGMKSLIPGMAAQRTVTRNHSWALDGKSGPGLTDDNPLFLDLWEGTELLGLENVQGVQFVLRGKTVVGVATGPLRPAHQEAIRISREVSIHTLPEKVDTLISVVDPPLNRSFYQAQKGLENCRQVVRKGGKLILIAECPEGIGNTAFYETLKHHGDAKAVVEAIRQDMYRFGDHKAQKLASLSLEVELYCLTRLSEDACQVLFMEKISLGELEELIREDVSQGKKVVALLDSGMNVLTIGKNEI